MPTCPVFAGPVTYVTCICKELISLLHGDKHLNGSHSLLHAMTVLLECLTVLLENLDF